MDDVTPRVFEVFACFGPSRTLTEHPVAPLLLGLSKTLLCVLLWTMTEFRPDFKGVLPLERGIWIRYTIQRLVFTMVHTGVGKEMLET